MGAPALYTLAHEYQEAAETLADMNLPEEVFNDTLEGLRGDIEAKATNVAMVIRNFEALAAQIKDAEKQMALRRKNLEHRADNVREYLLHNMQACGISKIESPWFALAVKQNPPAVEITGPVPAEYMRQPEMPPPEADKAAIKAALSGGEELEFARLVRGVRLEIKV